LNKRDFGNKLGKIGTRHTPRDDQVKPWIPALEKEPDSYIQSMILCIAECGWRRNHIKKLRWEDVQFDQTGRCSYVVADGQIRGFKTKSGIIAALPPFLAETLTKWHNESPCGTPDGRVWPNRSIKGRYDLKGELKDGTFDRIWHDFEDRWRLPVNSRFTSAYFRHFVSTQCRRAGLSGPPKAALCGHGFHADRQVFTDTYDNPGESEILDEQRAKMPHGRLWSLKEPSLQVVNDVPDEYLVLWKDLKEGRIVPSESLPRIERILGRVRVEEAKTLEP
jgi:integrase